MTTANRDGLKCLGQEMLEIGIIPIPPGESAFHSSRLEIRSQSEDIGDRFFLKTPKSGQCGTF
jgi:ethanolamine utilization microcompartment shell protein EutS